MEERAFADGSDKPTDKAIRLALGDAYTYYETIMTLVQAFPKDWQYSKNSWMLKVYDRKKALFYLIPWRNGLKTSLTLRESEKNALLRDEGLSFAHPKITSAKKFAEGYALEFKVTNDDECGEFVVFMSGVISIRS